MGQTKEHAQNKTLQPEEWLQGLLALLGRFELPTSSWPKAYPFFYEGSFSRS